MCVGVPFGKGGKAAGSTAKHVSLSLSLPLGGKVRRVG